MSENNKPASVGRDALGVLLMAVAVLSGVAIVMAVTKPVDENHSSFTAVYTGLVGAIGPVAGLFLALGIFVIGVRLWMAGFSDRTGRDLFGVLVTTLTLSILVGTLADGSVGNFSWAGRFGEVAGGSVTRRLTVFVGLPFGLACVLLPAWLFWLRSYFSARNKNAAPQSQTLAPQVRAPADTARPGSLSAALSAARPPTRTTGRPDAETDFGAVTADESAALLPRPAPPESSRKASASPLSPPTSPLPAPAADVRLHGGVPAGAQPLAPNHVHSPSAHPRRAAPVPLEPRGEPERAGKLPGAHLAPAEGLVRREAPAAAPPAVDPIDQPDDQPVGEGSSGGSVVGIPEPSWAGEPAVAELETERVRPILGAIDELESAPVEAGMLEPDKVEPADEATPLARAELADEPQPEALIPELETELAADLAREEAPAPAGDVTPLEQRPPPPSWEQPSLFDEPVDAYGTPQALVESLRKANEQTAERLSNDNGRGDTLADEGELEIGDDAASDGPRAVADELAEVDEAEDAVLEDEELTEPEPAPPIAEQPPAPQVRAESLFEVELQPQAPPAPAAVEPASPKRARKTERTERTERTEHTVEPQIVREPDADAAPADDLVYRAGLLFLERGRVAVSMLQREFGLDFKAATELLDQLQKAGLIGPYLGGQRRDILLTRDEWAQRIGVS